MSKRLSDFCLLLAIASPVLASAQATVRDGLTTALAGRWTGVLEYRDYQEPATSQKRVTLPTWLTITTEAWHYVYDDGPGKVVDADEHITFDPEHGLATMTPKDKAAQTFQVTGYDGLKAGRGTLALTGAGVDKGKPAQRRITLAVGRNLLTVLEEVRPAGTQDSFAFRHAYRLVRAEPPAVTQAR